MVRTRDETKRDRHAGLERRRDGPAQARRGACGRASLASGGIRSREIIRSDVLGARRPLIIDAAVVDGRRRLARGRGSAVSAQASERQRGRAWVTAGWRLRGIDRPYRSVQAEWERRDKARMLKLSCRRWGFATECRSRGPGDFQPKRKSPGIMRGDKNGLGL